LSLAGAHAVRLKKLELYGFKSFADRTTFEFEDSLSALVGPNGAGKSNVVDAIKWVLGERSAQKLRGSEMANVIFGGSTNRKPLNFADVKLTIDNADRWLPVDYEEVCIGRRVDRQGQSEFSINGQQCRLKDVRHLLLDTGVGTTSYSFIQQGQIDQLLRSSPTQRRSVFEEAAGINRFLEQKREAERKLERVGTNLTRVSDILEELQRQLRSVKYQAGRARTFKRQTEELQRLRLAYGLHARRRLQADGERHAAQIRDALAEKSRLNEQQATAERELRSAREALQSAQAELADSRQRITRADARLESLAREAELSRRRQEELAHRVEELGSRRESFEVRRAELDQEVRSARAELEENLQALADTADRLAALQRDAEGLRRERRAAEDALEARKSETFDLFQREADLRNQSEVLAAEKRALQNRLDRTENRQLDLAEQIGCIEAERGRTQERLEGLHAEQAALEAELQKLRRALADCEERLDAVAGRQAEARAELSARTARRDLLQDLESRAEGVGAGARRLTGGDVPGVVGLLARMVEAPLELAAAVEAALGPRAQAVLVETAADARRCLELLSGEEAGWADLIVLECLPRPARVELGPLPSVEGRLAELVRCDEAARPAVELLLGNVFLVQSTAVPALLASGLPPGAALVTSDGERYGADGLWSGGTPEGAALISRRSELASLEGEVADLQADVARLSAEREERSDELKRLRREMEGRSGQADKLRRSAGEVASHLQTVRNRGRELRDERHLARAEAETLSADIRDLDAQSAALREQSEQARRERAGAQRAAEAGQEQLRAMEQRQQELADQLSAVGSELARSREQERNLRALVERLEADRARADAELTSVCAEADQSAQRRQEAARAVEEAEAEARRLEAEKESLQAALQAESSTLEQIKGRIDELSERSEALDREREQLEERLHGLRMAENETTVKMQDLLERTAEDYGVRLEALERDPESWRDESPFLTRVIREFADEPPQARPSRSVAAWYREMESGPAERPEPEREADEDALEAISLEQAVALRDAALALADSAETDWEELRTRIARLKAKVDRIGNVNVDAIRQQEELEVRLQFLTDQKEDLESARRHQREIIRELNKKSRERFRETFEQVRQNFQTLFRKLFGGGAADLILDEEVEDVLEAGIEIMARPPGKETTSISLLSGGEKALTTVALLFAIFQAKPSPFCLLDEVDAPLDDSNVERFLMLLEEFRRDTQFIVITHNKLTMGVAQVLYGLTMTDGVSKQISVKFEEVDRRLAEEPPRAKAG
jgi:chromosome segregation protein